MQRRRKRAAAAKKAHAGGGGGGGRKKRNSPSPRPGARRVAPTAPCPSWPRKPRPAWAEACQSLQGVGRTPPRKGKERPGRKKKNPLTPSSAAPHQKNLLPFSQRGRLLDRLVHLPARQRVFLCGGRGLHPGRLQPGGPERAGEEREEGRRRGREKVGCFFFNLGPPHDFSSSPVSLLALSLALLLRSPTTTTPWTSSWTPTPPPRTP